MGTGLIICLAAFGWVSLIKYTNEVERKKAEARKRADKIRDKETQQNWTGRRFRYNQQQWDTGRTKPREEPKEEPKSESTEEPKKDPNMKPEDSPEWEQRKAEWEARHKHNRPTPIPYAEFKKMNKADKQDYNRRVVEANRLDDVAKEEAHKKLQEANRRKHEQFTKDKANRDKAKAERRQQEYDRQQKEFKQRQKEKEAREQKAREDKARDDQRKREQAYEQSKKKSSTPPPTNFSITRECFTCGGKTLEDGWIDKMNRMLKKYLSVKQSDAAWFADMIDGRYEAIWKVKLTVQSKNALKQLATQTK